MFIIFKKLTLILLLFMFVSSAKSLEIIPETKETNMKVKCFNPKDFPGFLQQFEIIWVGKNNLALSYLVFEIGQPHKWYLFIQETLSEDMCLVQNGDLHSVKRQ